MSDEELALMKEVQANGYLKPLVQKISGTGSYQDKVLDRPKMSICREAFREDDDDIPFSSKHPNSLSKHTEAPVGQVIIIKINRMLAYIAGHMAVGPPWTKSNYVHRFSG